MTHQALRAMAAEISVDETLRFESTRDITHEESCELIYPKSVVENAFLSVPAMISVSIRRLGSHHAQRQDCWDR
jgi:hypothetical protein